MFLAVLLRFPITCGLLNSNWVQPTNAFIATVGQMFGGSSQPLTTTEHCSLSELCSTIWLPHRRFLVLGSSRKLKGVAEHLIDGSGKRICRLSLELKSPYVIEWRIKGKW